MERKANKLSEENEKLSEKFRIDLQQQKREFENAKSELGKQIPNLENQIRVCYFTFLFSVFLNINRTCVLDKGS